MAKKSNTATIRVGDKRVFIDSDAIVDIELKSGVKYEKLRVVGINMMGDGLRVVTDDGVNQIPTNVIKSIKDSGETEFPGVTITNK